MTRNSFWQLNGTTTSRGLFHFIVGKVQTVFSDGSVSQCVRARINDTLSFSTPCFSCPGFLFFTEDMLRTLLVLIFNEVMYYRILFLSLFQPRLVLQVID